MCAWAGTGEAFQCTRAQCQGNRSATDARWPPSSPPPPPARTAAADEPAVIGRCAAAGTSSNGAPAAGGVQLAVDDLSCAAAHARVWRAPGNTYHLESLPGAPTWHNGRQLGEGERVRLMPADELEFGRCGAAAGRPPCDPCVPCCCGAGGGVVKVAGGGGVVRGAQAQGGGGGGDVCQGVCGWSVSSPAPPSQPPPGTPPTHPPTRTPPPAGTPATRCSG